MNSEPDLIAGLESQGLLTRDQAVRLRRAMAAGRSLEEALASTPIIEPLQLLRARQKLLDPPPAWRPEPVSRSVLDEPEPRVLDLDAASSDPPVAPAPAPTPPPLSPGPGGSSVRLFTPPRDKAAELGRQGSLQTVDISEHEGIPMVRELFAILDSAWIGDLMAVEFTHAGVLRVPASGRTLVGPSPLEPDLAARFIHHLGILARIAAWREEPLHHGAFRIRRGSRQSLALLELTGDNARATLYFFPEGEA